MDIGVFIPIGNNGWLISTTAPQYMPTFELNKQIVQKAEHYGLDFALSMIKLRGFGGPSEFWDYNLESFTLMAGLAAVTSRIQLFATCAVLTVPPPIAALTADPELYARINALVLRNTSAVNVLDGCAVSLPLGVASGAPVGLMLVGRRGEDGGLLRIAAGFEDALAQR